MPDPPPSGPGDATESQRLPICDTLRAREIDCLRLVGRGLRSKHIAVRLDLSPQTVDAYIKAAMRRLGVADRAEAALLLREHEKALPQSSGYPSDHLADRSETDDSLPRHEAVENEPLVVREKRIPMPLLADDERTGPASSPASWGIQLYDLARRHPAITFAMATFLFVMVLAGLLSAARNLQDILVSWVFPAR
jgi:DNA-binding CsgD family transcriptional regulator